MVGIIMSDRAKPPASAEKWPLRDHDDGVGDDADHDGGNAVEHVGGKANDVAEAVAAVFGDIDAGADSQWDADQAGNRKNHAGSDDGVGHAAAGFAHRLGSLGNEGPVERSQAAVDKIGKNREQRHQAPGLR